MDKPDLTTLKLLHGGHKTREDGVCALEAVAWLAGEAHSDKPACVSSVVANFVRKWNDDLNDEDRQILKPLLPLMVGTATCAADEEKRAWLVTDWLAREFAPAWLRLAGLTEHAEKLESLAAIDSTRSAQEAQPTIEKAREASAAAWDAARDAAWDAARDAARAAARAAAWDAAWDAAWAAARAAAWDAAWAAARAAAWDAANKNLDPTKRALQKSAVKLVDRMCEVGR